MSTCTQQTMTNHHHHQSGLLATIGDTLHTWRERQQARRELAHWTSRDLQDVGASWSDVMFEAEKPFWRA